MRQSFLKEWEFLCSGNMIVFLESQHCFQANFCIFPSHSICFQEKLMFGSIEMELLRVTISLCDMCFHKGYSFQ